MKIKKINYLLRKNKENLLFLEKKQPSKKLEVLIVLTQINQLLEFKSRLLIKSFKFI